MVFMSQQVGFSTDNGSIVLHKVEVSARSPSFSFVTLRSAAVVGSLNITVEPYFRSYGHSTDRTLLTWKDVNNVTSLYMKRLLV